MREALRLIMADDEDFHAGIDILCNLSGMVYPAGRILKGIVGTDPAKIARGPNRSFRGSRPILSRDLPPGSKIGRIFSK
jgi:hypothetical protein